MNTHRLEGLRESWKSEEQQPFQGWDFSYLSGRWNQEEPPWAYEDRMRELARTSSSSLDLGTGGGERLLKLREVFPPFVCATEGYPPNLRLARERLEPLGVKVVEAEDGLYKELPFENEAFDLITSRHTAYNIAEVKRVLKPDGTFLTQQVDGNSLSDLMEVFGVQPQWPYMTLQFALEGARSVDLDLIKGEEWTGKLIFNDVGALVYYLKAVSWTVPGFSMETHLETLVMLQQRMDREGELAFQEKRFMLEAQKV